MMNSTNVVTVVPLVLEKHPNADTLSICKVFDGGYQCVTSTKDWEGQTQAAFLPPDSIVPDLPEYAFLSGKRRITARRFRGVWSQGLLMPAPPGSKIGDDVTKLMGIEHYEGPMPKDAELAPTYSSPYRKGSWRGRLYGWLYNIAHPKDKQYKDPNVVAPKYDVEAWRKYRNVFNKGEEVVISEKIHGASAKYVSVDGKFYVGSRTSWKRDPLHDSSPWWWRLLDSRKRDVKLGWWWQAAKNCPAIERFCRALPGEVLYGEVYGNVQDLKYGAKGAEDVWFRAFDIRNTGGWWDYTPFSIITTAYEVPVVPMLYCGPYSHAVVEQFAEGKSVVPGADNIREGCVVRTFIEHVDPKIGRVQLKCISNAYLERAGGK